jgi:drug/metabolite transporter (DMT)-like permease
LYADKASATKIITVISIGVLAVSFAVLFIRWCDAPAFAIAAYRLAISSILLLATGITRLPALFKNFSRRDWLLAALSGVFLAIHFSAWIKSLEITSVASSVVLVSTAPFWAAFGAWLFLKATVRRLFFWGFLFAFAGMIFIAWQGVGQGQDSLFGNFLALLGAIGGAGYMLCGQALRRKFDTFSYVTVSYSFAAIFLLCLALLSDIPLSGFSWQTYGLFLLIALVPQLIGHTSFNWALKHLSTPVVSTILLGEPVFATILAFIFLAEIPTLAQIFGCSLVLAGIALAIWSER